MLAPGRSLERPSGGILAVELVSEVEFDAAFPKKAPARTDPTAFSALQADPEAGTFPEQPRVVSFPEQVRFQDATVPVTPEVTPRDGMIEATQLLAGGIIRDPANREVRETLPRLDLYERITQLCNIEGLEQLRLAKPGSLPDALVPTAFEETSIVDGVMVASKGAFRDGREWFAVSFECAVSADLESVRAFRFKAGPAIPRDEWEERNLIAEDFDDD